MNKVPDDISSIYPTLSSMYKNHLELRFIKQSKTKRQKSKEKLKKKQFKREIHGKNDEKHKPFDTCKRRTCS